MSSSPKTLYWCQRVSHFAKRNFPSRNTIPFEKRPTNQKNKLSKILPSKTLLNLNLFLVSSSWMAVSISRASWALAALPMTYKPASVGWLNLATLYEGWATVSGTGKCKLCTVPVPLGKHMCCVRYWPHISTSQIILALVWGLSGDADSYQRLLDWSCSCRLLAIPLVPRTRMLLGKESGYVRLWGWPGTEHNTSLPHSNTRWTIQPLLFKHEMVMYGSQCLLWRSCGFSLPLVRSLNATRNSTAWLTLGLKNVILHLHVSNHADPKSQSFF